MDNMMLNSTSDSGSDFSSAYGKQMLPDMPSEQPTAAQRKQWLDAAKNQMPPEWRAIARGVTPACFSDRKPVDIDT